MSGLAALYGWERKKENAFCGQAFPATRYSTTHSTQPSSLNLFTQLATELTSQLCNRPGECLGIRLFVAYGVWYHHPAPCAPSNRGSSKQNKAKKTLLGARWDQHPCNLSAGHRLSYRGRCAGHKAQGICCTRARMRVSTVWA